MGHLDDAVRATVEPLLRAGESIRGIGRMDDVQFTRVNAIGKAAGKLYPQPFVAAITDQRILLMPATPSITQALKITGPVNRAHELADLLQVSTSFPGTYTAYGLGEAWQQFGVRLRDGGQVKYFVPKEAKGCDGQAQMVTLVLQIAGAWQTGELGVPLAERGMVEDQIDEQSRVNHAANAAERSAKMKGFAPTVLSVLGFLVLMGAGINGAPPGMLLGGVMILASMVWKHGVAIAIANVLLLAGSLAVLVSFEGSAPSFIRYPGIIAAVIGFVLFKAARKRREVNVTESSRNSLAALAQSPA